jgi:hypothetical protein
MANLFSIISPDPRRLKTTKGLLQTNIAFIERMEKDCDAVIFCWGKQDNIEQASSWAISRFASAKCFGLNKDRSPMHPRALSYQKKLACPQLIDFKV